MRFCTTEAPTGVLMSDGRHAVPPRDRDADVAACDRRHDGASEYLAAKALA